MFMGLIPVVIVYVVLISNVKSNSATDVNVNSSITANNVTSENHDSQPGNLALVVLPSTIPRRTTPDTVVNPSASNSHLPYAGLTTGNRGDEENRL